MLEHCAKLEMHPACDSALDNNASNVAKLHLVEWVFNVQGSCHFTPAALSTELEELDNLVHELGQSHSEDKLQSLLRRFQDLMHTACWGDREFATAVRDKCPLTSCLGSQSMEMLFKNGHCALQDDADLSCLKSHWECVDSACTISILDFWNMYCRPIIEA